MLEFSQCLENFLWPNYLTGESTKAHMMSIVILLNEKFRERVPVWEVRKLTNKLLLDCFFLFFFVPHFLQCMLIYCRLLKRDQSISQVSFSKYWKLA